MSSGQMLEVSNTFLKAFYRPSLNEVVYALLHFVTLHYIPQCIWLGFYVTDQKKVVHNWDNKENATRFMFWSFKQV